MNLRQHFCLALCFATVFATVFVAPIFSATIEESKTIDEAKTEYLSQVNKLSTNPVYVNVRPTLKDSVKSIANSQTNIAGAAAKLADTKATEQSSANKLLGAATMGATGIGGMNLAQGMAEQQADTEASADMQAYLSTIKCGINNAQNVPYKGLARTPVVTKDFAVKKNQYLALAQKMKAAKEALGQAPGIESEVIMSTDGLYDNDGTDTDGIVHRFDDASERLASGDGQNRATTGGITAGVGAVGGIVGNNMISSGGKGGDSGGGLGGLISGLGGSGGSGVLKAAGGLLGGAK